MPTNRPIGHIAGSLAIVAMTIAQRVNAAHGHSVHICWLDDSGCLYLQPTTHPAAQAVLRVAPDQVVQRYRKQPGFGWQHIADDLDDARCDFATRHLAEACAA